MALPEGMTDDRDRLRARGVVIRLNKASQSWLYTEDSKTFARDGAGAKVLAVSAGIVEQRQLQAGEHRKQVRLAARCVTEEFVLRITEGVGFPGLIVRAEKRRQETGKI